MPSILDLPDEILLMIFGNLPLTDLVAVSNVNEKFYDVLNSEICKRGLNLQKSYMLNSKEYKHFFYKRSISSELSNLYMNGLWHYKLPVQIINCRNLRVLHMMDIQLSFNQLIKIVTSFNLLEDLSFVFPSDTSENKMEGLKNSVKNLDNIRKLEYATHCQFVSSIFLQLTSMLEILLISSTDNSKAATSKISNRSNNWPFFSTKFLKEFHFHVGLYNNVSYLDYKIIKNMLSNLVMKELSVLNIFTHVDPCKNNDRFSRPVESMINNTAVRRQEVVRLGMSLQVECIYLQEHCSYPHLKELVVTGEFFNPINNYVKCLIMPSLRSFHFLPTKSPTVDFGKLTDEFPNLRKFSYSCLDNLQHVAPKKIIDGISRLISLVHLSIPPCIFLEACKDNDNNDSPGPIQFKKQRKSLMPGFTPQIALFNTILDKCQSIQTLEIATFQHFPRSHSNPHVALLPECQSLCNIKKLKNLTHLTLEDIPIYNSFFDSVAEGCTKLEFLRIKNLGKCINCEYKLSLAKVIPLMQNLHSFRIEQNSLYPLGDLLSSLSKCLKLERVFMHTALNESNKLDSNIIISFILNNPKLIFAWLQLGSVTKMQLKYIKNAVAKKKVNHLYFQIISTDTSLEHISRMPIIQLEEMVHYNPWIFDTKIS